MAYSAQFTALAPYAIPTPFLEGIANKIEIPVISGTASLLNNFIIDGNNNLQYIGSEKARIVVKAIFNFGSQQPSQLPTSPLDVGPKSTMYGFIQVGNQQSVPSQIDQTLYYSNIEYPYILYSMSVDQEFLFCPGDVIKFYSYYLWIVPPIAPVDPLTYYFTINQASLSWIINSDDHACSKAEIPHPIHAENKVTMVLGPNVNTRLYEFKASRTGKTLIYVRLNITSELIHNNNTGLDTVVGNGNWAAYLAVNDNLVPNNIVLSTLTTHPNLLQPGYQIWPSTIELYLLADLCRGDKVEVISNVTFGIAPSLSPPYITFIPDGQGYIAASMEYDIIMTPPLYPSAMITPIYNSSILLPLHGNLDHPKEFPLEGSEVKFSNEFKLECSKLVYRGEHSKWFKVRFSLNFAKLLLTTSNLDPVVTTLQQIGLAVGVNGRHQNHIRTYSNMYADTRYGYVNSNYNMKWLATQSATNDIHLHHGDYISVLLYSNNAVYLNVPPVFGIVYPVNTPSEGSVSQVTATANIVIEEGSQEY